MNGGATVSPLHYLPMKEMSNHLEGGEQRKGKKNDEGELTASSCDLAGAGVRVPDRPSLCPACRPRGRWRKQACPHGPLSIEAKCPAPHLARGRGSAGVSQGGLGRHSEHWQGHVCLENLLGPCKKCSVAVLGFGLVSTCIPVQSWETMLPQPKRLECSEFLKDPDSQAS